MSDALDDAAAAALWWVGENKNPAVEHIGLLYAGPQGVARTDTQTSRSREQTGGAFSIPAGSLRGLFHNHPINGQTTAKVSRPSADDVKQAKALGVPSYISVGQNIFRYDPATGETEPVLAQIPIDEIRKLYLVEALKK